MGWYSEQYKKRYSDEISQIKKVVGKPQTPVKFLEQSLYKELEYPLKNEKKVWYIKLFILLIPTILMGYLIYNNLIASHEFVYWYDIGSNENYLSPESRISLPVSDANLTYRNLTSSLVYFSVPIPRNAEKIKIETRFKPQFPEEQVFIVGAKDREDWHYTWDQLFNPALNDLSAYESIENVYLINKDLYLVPYEELKYERNVIVASDNAYPLLPNIITGYNNNRTTIPSSLRGGHTFFIYAQDDLEMNIQKQDINWYPGEDVLEVTIFDSDENIIGNLTIEDDGITDVSKIPATIQEKNGTFKNLKKGVYKVQFSNFDGLIRQFSLNTNKIVSNKLFLADNPIYNVDKINASLYIETFRPTTLSVRTWHYVGLQNISINNQSVAITQLANATYLSASPGKYYIESTENDLVIESPSYFSFSKENYFEPYKQIITPIKNNEEWIKNNVDYLVTDYKKPRNDGEWLIAETEFDAKKDNLYIKDNKISFVFNIPHLSNPEYANYSIPIDWIKVTVYKEGILP